MPYFPLHSDWTVRLVDGPAPDDLRERLAAGIPATVPGVVHTDLIAAGLISDPDVDDAESTLHWIGESDWEYRNTFTWTPSGQQRDDLVAEGLDTVATVSINGQVVARTANQHRTYRVDLTGVLREGENEVVVRFRSPAAYAREQEEILGERPHSYTHPFNAIRKAAYNFGWDWGPDFATSGIWRALGIESWSGVRLSAVRPQTWIRDGVPGVSVQIELERGAGVAGPVTARIEVAGRAVDTSIDGESTEVELLVPEAELWWPRSHGAQPRYPLAVSVAVPEGPTASWERPIGFRSVELDLSADEIGSAFTFRINGEDVYVRGANWIPDDTFLPRITRESLARSLQDAVDANMNMVRVWGGGIYESDDFYDLCDEMGLLVWQDFLLACAAYSEDEPLWSEFEAEAVDAVNRLSSHPSLVLWNGCNENIWGYIDWNWRSRLGGMTWGEAYYRTVFPDIVRRLAPATPYSEGSPYSFSDYVHPNDDRHGSMHIWDVWNQVDYDVYRSYRPRFVSEFGFQGPPAYSTLEYAVHDEPRHPFGPNLLVHQKANDGNGKLQRGLGAHLPYPEDFEDWHWATQLNQARAVRFGIEHFRSLHPENQGAIVWQLNDCWPSVSWAAVDSRRQRKPLWYALRDVFADRLLTVQPVDDGLVAAVHNDSPVALEGPLVAERRRLDGEVLASVTLALDVSARSTVRVQLPAEVRTPGDPLEEYVVVRVGDTLVARWYDVEDTALRLPGDALEAVAEPTADGYVVEVTARALVKDVTLLADKVDPDADVDIALQTLDAGETRRFVVRARAGLDPRAFLSPRVLRSANDLVAAGTGEHAHV